MLSYRMPKKYPMPEFLIGKTTPEAYGRWLARKAEAHLKRDQKRGCADGTVSRPAYKQAIHLAVVTSGGYDAYTGEVLDWHLISTYDNEKSQKGKHAYKATLALLPSVDHVEAGSFDKAFRICAWRTNDAKNDLSVEAFVALCQRVVAFAEAQSQAADAA